MSDERIYPDCVNAHYCVNGWKMGKGCFPDDLSSAAGGKSWQECHCLIDPDGKLETIAQRNARWLKEFAARPKTERQQADDTIAQLRAQVAALTAERDAAVKDAARYRWLRDVSMWHVGPGYETYNDVIVDGENFNYGDARLDAAIDRASLQEPKA